MGEMDIKDSAAPADIQRSSGLLAEAPPLVRRNPGNCLDHSASCAPKDSRTTVSSKRILVVDNEPASTRLVRLTLERTGFFEVQEVNDPTRALAEARRFQPHLVLLDIEMPGLDGSGVARQFRDDPRFHNVPILFMTSLVTPEEAEGRIYAVGSRVLAKPVTISRLLKSIAEMLSNILTTGQPLTSSVPD